MRPKLVLTLSACALTVLANAQDASGIYRRAKAGIVKITARERVGTGFVVGDGTLICTSAHVVKGLKKVAIDGVKTTVAKVLFTDEVHDLAILKSEEKFPETLSLETKAPDPGSRIYVIGSALGVFDRTITDGLVSGVRELNGASLLQISAPITDGNSGSPVLDSAGNVVGMAESSMNGTSVNFALSAKNIQTALASQEKKVALPATLVGYLGQAIQVAEVKESPDTHSKTFSKVKANQYLVVQPSPKADWDQVLLNRGMYGYLPSSLIRHLPYEFVLPHHKGNELATFTTPASISRWSMSFLGAPYRKGGTNAKTGFGNGEFVTTLFKSIGVNLPPDPAKQALIGKALYKLEELEPGDRLYFWDGDEGEIGKVALYEGNGMFLMSDPMKGKVSMEALDQKWRNLLVAARR